MGFFFIPKLRDVLCADLTINGDIFLIHTLSITLVFHWYMLGYVEATFKNMKKRAVTIGCFTCHMPTQQILTCDPNSQWSLHAFFMEDSAIHKTVMSLC